jgi:hypothetical protein
VTETYLTSGSPNQNHGGETFFRLQSSGKNRGLLFVDKVAIQQAVGTGTLLSATLQLTIDHAGTNWGTTGRPISLHRLKQASAEYSATWSCALDQSIQNQAADCLGTTAWSMNSSDPNVQPWVSTATGTTTITNNQVGVVSFDVTADVAAILANGWAGYGWLLKKVEESQNGAVDFRAHEQGSGPQLVLQVQSASPTDAGTIDAGPMYSTTITANADSYVRQGQPNQNFGTSTILRVQSSGRNRAVVNFDANAIHGVLGGNGLQHAVLQIAISKTFDNWGADRVLGVHHLRSVWSELGATWNCGTDTNPNNQSADCNGPTAWAMWAPELPQGQIAWVDPPISTALISSAQTGVVTFDVTTELACELAGFTPFNGFLIKKEAEQQAGHIEFASRETVTPPVLVLDHRAGAGVSVTSTQCAGLLQDDVIADAGVDAGGCTSHATIDDSCDGVDDDCDGTQDEDYTVIVSTCGQGACQATGELSCVNGVVQNSCVVGAPGASDATCDGIDDNCNGIADEDYVGGVTHCGIGACARSGERSCIAGVEQDSCEEGAAADDANCNGLDEDCDGTSDEAFPFACSTQCTALELSARAGAGGNQDGTLDLPEAASIALPSSAERLSGTAAGDVLTLTYQSASTGESVECVYLESQSGQGGRYTLDSCTNGARAGDAVMVESLRLHLASSSTPNSETVARIHFDRCGSGFGLIGSIDLPSYSSEEFPNNPLIAAPTGAHHVLVLWKRGTTWSEIESVLAPLHGRIESAIPDSGFTAVGLEVADFQQLALVLDTLRNSDAVDAASYDFLMEPTLVPGDRLTPPPSETVRPWRWTDDPAQLSHPLISCGADSERKSRI